MNAGDAVSNARFGDLFDSCPNRSIIARTLQLVIDE
jgi:hypothetical protein